MNDNFWHPYYETLTDRTWIDAWKRLYTALEAVKDQLAPNAPSETGYTEAELLRLMERLATGR